MPENDANIPLRAPNDSQRFGTVPHVAESFGNLPNDSEGFRKVPNDSESFRTLPKGSERKESHTLTVREVARMFEAAGVARTERSITNWCQPNRNGIARLDSYFDPNERRYFITLQSAEQAMQEEKVRSSKGIESSEPARSVPNASEKTPKHAEAISEMEIGTIKKLEQEIMDLKITNRGKDYFIEQLEKERNGFVQERELYVEKLMTFNRKVGELETKLLQIGAPNEDEKNGYPSA